MKPMQQLKFSTPGPDSINKRNSLREFPDATKKSQARCADAEVCL
jgi:hypothetical protein